jgi:hypothetical protein
MASPKPAFKMPARRYLRTWREVKRKTDEEPRAASRESRWDAETRGAELQRGRGAGGQKTEDGGPGTEEAMLIARSLFVLS